MSICGYAILAVNEDGSKAQCREINSLDVRLDDGFSDYEPEVNLLPDGVRDCLVMCFFSFHSWAEHTMEGTEYECEIRLESFTVMQEGFKEFDRKQISYQVTSGGCDKYPREFNEIEKDWFDEIIENWELLYDEEFELAQSALVLTEQHSAAEAVWSFDRSI